MRRRRAVGAENLMFPTAASTSPSQEGSEIAGGHDRGPNNSSRARIAGAEKKQRTTSTFFLKKSNRERYRT